MKRMRVLHFVTGGFSGATSVALTLVQAARHSDRLEAVLVLRRKRQTDDARIEALRNQGLQVEVVPGWSHAATVASLMRLCRRLKPDVLVAHGFSEHLWGRWAGLLAGVPALVQVEHNSRERYGRWRLAQTRWLARRTARIVGCSEGVRQSLLAQGLPEDRLLAIPNGIPLEPFADAPSHPFELRVPGIVMAARFSRQKDHETLVRAVALLRERGLAPPVWFAGGGSERHRQACEALVRSLGLQEQVRLMGFHRDMPGLLMRHTVCALSSHYEGMPLSLVEGMAAGCAVIGSDVPGIRELIEDGRTGRLVREGDPRAWADALQSLLDDVPTSARMAGAGRAQALARHGLERMTADYESMLLSLVP